MYCNYSGICRITKNHKLEVVENPTPFNKAEAKEELIDIWHFVVQASLELNLSPEDILEQYKRKNHINRDRQKNGY